MTDTGAPPGPADQATALVRDGQALFAAGEVERARECFQRALALVPGQEEARVGLERCARLMVEPVRAPGDSFSTPAWPGRAATDDDSDIGAPEATVVDPMYVREAQQEVARLQATMPAQGAEFPEPQTVPSSPMPQPPGGRISSLTPATEVSGGMSTEPSLPAMPAAPVIRVEPAYPRYSSGASHYPELLPGGRAQSSGVHAGTAPPLPAPPGPMPSAAQQAPPFAVPPGAFPPFATPAPMGGPVGLPYLGRPRRWSLMLAGVGIGCALLGFLLGMAASGGDDSDEPVATTPDAGAAATAPTPTAPTTPAVPVGQIVARATAATHPALANVSSPGDGEIIRVHEDAGAAVKRGTKLFTIKSKPTDKPTDKKKKEPAVVTARDAGLFAPAVRKGDDVEDGAALGAILDPTRWWVIADLPGDAVSLDWTCELASADGGTRVPCTLDRIERIAGATRATAGVPADAAPWLATSPTATTLTVTPTPHPP